MEWPTREAEADYRRAVDLLMRPNRANGLDGLLLLRSLAVEGRHPAARGPFACRRRPSGEAWAAGIDWDVAMGSGACTPNATITPSPTTSSPARGTIAIVVIKSWCCAVLVVHDGHHHPWLVLTSSAKQKQDLSAARTGATGTPCGSSTADQFSAVADDGATASPTSLFHSCARIEAEILARADDGGDERPGPFERAVAT
ncbi:uncharacterized protein ACA1_326210, partial [Acanthamoeba castellanii str. Neff]